VDAGYAEECTGKDGQQAMRLTPSGELVARQLAMVAEDDAAAMMAGLLGDGPRSCCGLLWDLGEPPRAHFKEATTVVFPQVPVHHGWVDVSGPVRAGGDRESAGLTDLAEEDGVIACRHHTRYHRCHERCGCEADHQSMLHDFPPARPAPTGSGNSPLGSTVSLSPLSGEPQIGPTELRSVREMANCLGEQREGRWPP
jgi:hypothetical protein